MHDAKRLLHDVEKQLEGGQTDGAEAKLAQAIEIMNKAPNDPRVNWGRVQYNSAIAVLKGKMALSPRMAKLRSSYRAVADLQAQGKPDGKALVAAADTCIATFKDAESSGANLNVPQELTPGKSRPLRDDLADCEAAKKSGSDTGKAPDVVATNDPKPAGTGDTTKPATTDKPKAAGGSDGGVPRAKWVKKLKGDRKRIFEEHADAFPEYEGDPGPKGAAKAAEWKYGSEVFKFKGSKLAKEKK